MVMVHHLAKYQKDCKQPAICWCGGWLPIWLMARHLRGVGQFPIPQAAMMGAYIPDIGQGPKPGSQNRRVDSINPRNLSLFPGQQALIKS